MYIVTTNGAVGIYKKNQHRPVGTQERPPGGVGFHKRNPYAKTPPNFNLERSDAIIRYAFAASSKAL